MPRLSAYILASLALHGGIVWWYQTTSPFQSRAAASPLSISLSGLTQDNASHSRPKTGTLTKATRDDARQAVMTTDHGQTAPVREPAQTKFSRTEYTVHVMARVQSELFRYFQYPLLARRNGWQGRVLLEFFLASDGTIQNLHIHQSSGYTILDDSAMQAMQHVRRIEINDMAIEGRGIDISLPVIFQLQEG